MDYYKILGTKKSATQAEIQQAFKQKAKESHPDVGGNSDEFIKIQKAYKVLSDPLKRQEYDSGESIEFVDNPLEYVQKLWENFL